MLNCIGSDFVLGEDCIEERSVRGRCAEKSEPAKRSISASARNGLAGRWIFPVMSASWSARGLQAQPIGVLAAWNCSRRPMSRSRRRYAVHAAPAARTSAHRQSWPLDRSAHAEDASSRLYRSPHNDGSARKPCRAVNAEVKAGQRAGAKPGQFAARRRVRSAASGSAEMAGVS
jgi:hypothetical protein